MHDFLLFGLIVLQTLLLLLLTWKLWRTQSGKALLSAVEKSQGLLLHQQKDEFQRNRKETHELNLANRKELQDSLFSFERKLNELMEQLNNRIRHQFSDFATQQDGLNKSILTNIKDIRSTVEKHLQDLRTDNHNQLNEMRKTVDEKLQNTLEKRLGESFKLVSERLELVHKGLGEMQQVATGVGDLKKVLSNVKTRGVLGEYQLANILEQLLTPEQYARNVATKKGSQAHVEFAVKLPGNSSDQEVWMPIDSKFPISAYQELLDASEHDQKEQIALQQKQLLKALEGFAKEISEKYIDPPHTTDFAIMFLPIESLYAEVLRHPGLFETIQRKYRITITGPTTLSALLNSLQMGFRTLAVQKRSSEVWNTLQVVKKEFEKFSMQLDKVDKHLNTASKSLYELKHTRSNVMNKRLNEVELIERENKQIK